MLTGGGWGGGADAGALTDRAVAAAVLPVQKAVLRLAAAAGTGNGDRRRLGAPHPWGGGGLDDGAMGDRVGRPAGR